MDKKQNKVRSELTLEMHLSLPVVMICLSNFWASDSFFLPMNHLTLLILAWAKEHLHQGGS